MTATPGSTPRPGSARAWLLAARPATLSAAIIPVAVGTGVAHALSSAQLWPALAALFGAIWIQIGTNFANDVYDFKKGADTSSRVGPMRAAQAGLLSPGQLFRGIAVVFALATACGIYLTMVAGFPIVVIGLLSLLSGLAYTGGPYPLGYNGLGDIFVLVFFGFVAVCGTAFVQMGTVPALAWWCSVPIGSLATAILVVNNIRDAETDVLCGKRTVAVRFGRKAARAEYVVLLVCAYLVPTFLVARGDLPLLGLCCWLTAPLALMLIAKVTTSDDPSILNPCLKQSALLLLANGSLLTLALMLG